jgi:prepilin-type N-terminal cleavage/methylation domain-containing protein
MRPGYTLAETVVVLLIAGVAMAIVIPRGVRALDRLVVQSAAADVRATHATARAHAIAGAAAVTVDVDSAMGTLRLRRGTDTLLTRGIGHAHGVRLTRTRDSLTFGSRGLGRGAANLSIVVRRGSAVETVFVSRLGRVR